MRVIKAESEEDWEEKLVATGGTYRVRREDESGVSWFMPVRWRHQDEREEALRPEDLEDRYQAMLSYQKSS